MMKAVERISGGTGAAWTREAAWETAEKMSKPANNTRKSNKTSPRTTRVQNLLM
jgi:hypothetical protein